MTKKWDRVLIFGLLLAVILSMAAGFDNDCETVRENVLRLHILANSDSEEDQALKLLVRDGVLEQATEILEESSDRQQAEEQLRSSLPELQEIAAGVIAAQGYDYPVRVELADTAFPTKEYDGFTLPAGNYLALRVIIGEGAGQNWWCVVFPPLCTAAAEEVPAAALSAGLSQEEVGLITEENQGYVLKFKSVELWEHIQEILS